MRSEDALPATSLRPIDTASGVESAPGIKDTTKITAFLGAVAAC